MKRSNKILIRILFVIIMLFSMFQLPLYADVGDFDSYDSGWDSWDSSSSGWDYSDDFWDDDSGFSSGFYVGFSGFPIVGIGAFVIIVIVIIIIAKQYKNGTPDLSEYIENAMDDYNEMSEEQIVSEIKVKDQNFSKDEFLSWARDLFIKLQYAWSDRNWETIRCFETPQLFEQHRTQLQRYIENKQINKLERISVNSARLLDFKEEGEREVLSVLLSTKMIDYIIDEQTGKVLKGSKTEYRTNSYKLTFVRKAGVKTVLGTVAVNTTNCPNCGAPTEITSAGKCSYCGSVITTGNFSWVLSNLEPYKSTSRNNINHRNHNRNDMNFVAGMIIGEATRGIMRETLRPRPPRGPHRPGPGRR